MSASDDAPAAPGRTRHPRAGRVAALGRRLRRRAALVRASRVYRRVTTILIVSLVVPYVVNLLYNFDVGPFGRFDLTPFLLIGSCLVLVWGLFRFRLLGIRPVARGRRGGPQPGHGRQRAARGAGADQGRSDPPLRAHGGGHDRPG
ncbi:MAG TPA: histidine kinase N-terminal 7TM domain-containing protein, partial [Actinomycetes bacterium]